VTSRRVLFARRWFAAKISWRPGSIAAAKEKAQVRLEGKEYIVQEGDVILFRHSG